MQQQKLNLSNKKKQLNNFSKYSSMAFQMMAIICVGTFGGLKLDKLINNNFPYFTVSLSILSVVLAVYFAIKDIIRFNK